MLDLTLRPATLDDAPLAADLATVRDPGSPADPVLQRHAWEIDATMLQPIREQGAALSGLAIPEAPAQPR